MSHNVHSTLPRTLQESNSTRPVTTVLYALGSNGNSQLGLLHAEDISSPEQCHFTCTTDSDSDNTINHVPLAANEQIKKVVAGGNHTLLVTTQGRVWSAGLNQNGERGLSWPESGETTDLSSRSGLVEAETEIVGESQLRRPWVHLSWTGSHTLTPPSSGIESTNVNNHFANVVDIAATFSASFFLINGSSTTQIYCCGFGAKGELGIGSDRVRSMVPRLCFDLRTFETDEDSKIVQISACMSHVVVLSSVGRVYGWGASRKGQLGRRWRREKIVWEPQLVDLEQMIWQPQHVVTGRDFTFLVGAKAGEEQLFLGEEEKLGIELPLRFNQIEDTESTNDDKSTPLPEVYRVGGTLKLNLELFAGWTSILTRTSHGIVAAFGNSRRGIVPEKQPIKNVQRLAVGSEHALGLLNNGHVIAWGWGEHGNCGPDIDQRNNVGGGYNTIFVPVDERKVIGIAAGCATSFIWIEQLASEDRDLNGSTKSAP